MAKFDQLANRYSVHSVSFNSFQIFLVLRIKIKLKQQKNKTKNQVKNSLKLPEIIRIKILVYLILNYFCQYKI